MAPTLAGSKVVASSDCKFAKSVEMSVGSTMPPNQGDKHCRHTRGDVLASEETGFKRRLLETFTILCEDYNVGSGARHKLRLFDLQVCLTQL